jgi:nicotinamide-nucleotide amidase
VDDVTRDAAAQATGRALVLHEACWAEIQALFARWGRPVGDNNRRQAFLPEGAEPITNPVGTAPGFLVEVEKPGTQPALLICLPGVPREMKHLMQESVEPLLAQHLGPDRVAIRTRVLRTVGMGESAIDTRIEDLMQLANPTVGLAAHLGQVDIRITARAASLDEAEAMIDGLAREIYGRLGRAVFGEGEEPLEGAVVRLLDQSQQTLALLETNTGGELAQRLLSVPRGSQVVRLARVTDDPGLLPLAGTGLVSAEAAERSAAWLLSGGEASLALAVCGTLDPAAGPYGSYRGETFVAVAADQDVRVTRVDVGGTGELARRWSGNAALNLLRLHLLA